MKKKDEQACSVDERTRHGTGPFRLVVEKKKKKASWLNRLIKKPRAFFQSRCKQKQKNERAE